MIRSSGSVLKLLIGAFSFGGVMLLPHGNFFATANVNILNDQNIFEVMGSISHFSLTKVLVETAQQEILFQDKSTKRMVFVPIDDSFLDFSSDIMIHFLTDQRWKLHLIHFLRYHMIHETADLTADTEFSVETLADEMVTVRSSLDGGIILNSIAESIDETIVASNGAIQGIDHILVPTWHGFNIAGVLELDPSRFSMIVALGKKDTEFMGAAMSSSWEPYTIFAPTNEALSDSRIFEHTNIHDLPNFLSYHLVPGIYTDADLMHVTELNSLTGQSLTVNVNMDQRTLKINGNLVIQSNILANNGILHVIDGPLIPPLNETYDPTSVKTPPQETYISVDQTDRCTLAWIEWLKSREGYDEARRCSQMMNKESLSLDSEQCGANKCSLNSNLNSLELEEEYNKCLFLKAIEESRGDHSVKCSCQRQELGDGNTFFRLECVGSNIACSPKYAECDSNERCCNSPLRRCVGGLCRDAQRPMRKRMREAIGGFGNSIVPRTQN